VGTVTLKAPTWDDTVPVDDTPIPKWEDTTDPKPEELSLLGFGKNVISGVTGMAKGVKSMVQGAAKIPGENLESAGMMGLGLPFGQTPTAERFRTIGRGAASAVKSIPQSLVDLVRPKKWYEHPVENTMTAGSLVLPFLKGGAAAKGGTAAAVEAAAQVAPVAAEVAAPAAAGIGRRVFAKASQAAFGVPEDATLARMANPAGVKTAFAHAELADQMTNSVKNLGEHIGTLADEAKTTLRSSPYIEEGAIPKTKIGGAIKAARRDLGGVFSEDSQKAAGALKRVADNYKKLKSTVSEAQVKDLIQQIDGDINWENPAASKTNKALVGVRTRLDAMLKKQNPAYEEAMKPVSEATRIMDKVKSTFGIKRETGKGFVPGDQTVGKLQRALREDKLQTKDILTRFEKVTGEDWSTKIRNANAKSSFEGETIRGARRAVAGGGVGMGAGELIGHAMGLPPAMGGAVGTSLGAISGAFLDVYGRSIAAKITDALVSPKMARYVSILEKAAVKGPANVGVAHALLFETDPNYAAAMKASGVRQQ
jgi:hypothetical protein